MPADVLSNDRLRRASRSSSCGWLAPARLTDEIATFVGGLDGRDLSRDVDA
jgi:hypothetical protein